METAEENNFRNGRVRKSDEFSTMIGADGMGYSKFHKLIEDNESESFSRFEKIPKRKPKYK